MDMNWDQHDIGAAEPLLPAPDGSRQADNRALRFSASQSQIGFFVQAPAHDGILTDGYLEMDFLKGVVNGPRDNLVNATPRLRLALARFRWNDGDDALIFGQTYTLFGDLYPSITFDNLSLTLGKFLGREPQVQYTHVSAVSPGSQITYAFSVNAPNSGLFNQATGTAETSGVPFVHAKMGYQTDALGKADYFGFETHDDLPAQIALSGFFGREKIVKTLGGNQDVNAWGVALNGVLPIVGIRDNRRAGAASIASQIWVGQHVGSYFGANGQAAYETLAGRVNGIRAYGGFVEGKYFLTRNLNMSTLYSLDNNNLDDLTRAGIKFRIASGIFSDTAFGAPGVNKARTVDVSLWYNPFDRAFFGVVWDSRKATYNSGVNGTNNRINFSMFYNF